ncbi:helitron_like_N domain-containing protein [Trichonephila clavipes]|nr:helitron_like_N domain-containing protein [Trichonephila clavipes]
MQQYVVDSYVEVESNRLNFIRPNQRTLRVESYLGLADHVNTLVTEASMRTGVTLILPSSFIGSLRAIQQNFQVPCRLLEILAHDRSDLVARIFDIKKKALLQDMKKNGIFGCIAADIHVIEFQKRGLPHTYLLLILAEEDKI